MVTVGVFGPGDIIPVIEDSPAIVGMQAGAPQEIAVGGEGGGRVSNVPDIKYQFYNLSISIHRGYDISTIPGMTSCPFVRVS